MDYHRVALEPRSGIWLLFYESLIHKGFYKQQLLRIFKDFDSAEEAALFVISDRKINCALIVRDDSKKNVMIRTGGE